MLVALCLAAASLAAGGCSDNVGRLIIEVTRSPITGEDPFDQRLVAFVRVRVDGPDGRTGPETFELAAGAGELPDIPTGPDQVVTIEGLGPEGSAPVSRGRSAPLTINDGDNRVRIYVGRVGAFSRAPAHPDGPLKGRSGLGEARAFHSASALADGRVLLHGGATSRWRPETGDAVKATGTSELLDDSSLLTSPLSCGAGCGVPRGQHTATVLPTGNVLLAGGLDDRNGVADLGVFRADSGTFFRVGRLQNPRSAHGAALVGDDVYIAGGQGGATLPNVERFTDGALSTAPVPQLLEARRGFALVAPSTSQLVAVGGFGAGGAALASTERWTVGAPSWTDGPSLKHARGYARVVKLGDAYYIIGGLDDSGQAVGEIERLRLKGDTLVVEATGASIKPRWAHAATALDDNTLLVTGGFADGKNGSPSNTVEIVSVSDSGLVQVSELRPMNQRRAGHTQTLLRSGNVVVTGGVGPDALNSVEVFIPQ